MIEVNIPLGAIKPVEFYGIHNSRLGIIKNISIFKYCCRGSELKVRGNEKEIEDFRVKIEQVVTHLEDYGSISDANLQSLLFGLKPNELTDTQHLPEDVIVHGPNGLMVKARTPNQKVMVHLAQDHDIVFAIGPAGTGKLIPP